MESALMIVPPSRSASSRAAADLPLAVGPAMRMAVGRRGSAVTLAGGHGDEAQLALGVGEQQQNAPAPRALDRQQPGDNVLRLPDLFLGDFDDDIARLDVLLRRRAVGLDVGDDHAFDACADAVFAA